VTEQDGHPAAGPPAVPASPPVEPSPDRPVESTAPTEQLSTQRPAGPPPDVRPDLPPRDLPPPVMQAAPPMGVPPRPQPLPPPRPVRPPAGAVGSVARPTPRSASAAVRPPSRPRKARLVLKRIDPWSVFLYSVVASIFIGIATLVAVGVLYAVLSKLGVLSSLNTLIGDVTAEPGTTAEPAHLFSAGKVMTFATLIAALDVVLITALSTLAAFLYNVCAALTGGIEVTLTDQG